jgi:hypothetical protein
MIVTMLRRLTVLALLALLVAPAAEAASTGPVFGLRAAGNPKLGYFVYSVSPGSAAHGAIIVSNTGNRAGTVKLYSADATTGRTTGTVYLTDKAATATGSWVQLSKSSLTLLPGRHATVQFTVRAPPGAKPGEWVSGIVAETAQPAKGSKTKQKTNVQIRIRNLTIVAVQVNVPGPRIVGFTVGAVTTGGQKGFQQVIVHFANTGNVLSKPKGTVAIFDSSGARIERLPFTMDTFLPQTAIDYPVLLKKALAPGDYRADTQLLVPGATGAAGKTLNASTTFSVSKQDVTQVFTSTTPTQAPASATASSKSNTTRWLVIAGAVAALLALVLLLLWLARRRRTHGAALPEPAWLPEPSAAESAAAPAASAPPIVPAQPAQPAQPAATPQFVPVATPPQPAPLGALAPYLNPRAEPAEPAAAVPVPATPFASCDHLWEVAYDRGQLGGDGVWRFPHRCRTCGLELFAADIADASAQAVRTASA